jgi:hypothetical protein
MKLEFSDRFLKKSRISSFIKIRPVGAELSHVYGQTDMVIVAFRNYGYVSKIATVFHLDACLTFIFPQVITALCDMENVPTFLRDVLKFAL